MQQYLCHYSSEQVAKLATRATPLGGPGGWKQPIKSTNSCNYFLQKANLRMILHLLFILFSSFSVGSSSGAAPTVEKNPFTPKAFLIRYWDKKIHNNFPKPPFLLSKASPLSAVEATAFAKLAANHALSTRLPEFCSSAHLLCFSNLESDLEKQHNKDSNFALYQNKNFSNYGTGRLGGIDSFKNYSDTGTINVPLNDFQQYSRDSTRRKESFLSYGSGGNVVEESFHNYAAGATGGSGAFNNYADPANGSDDLRFTSYSDGAKARSQSFSSYTENGVNGHQSFTSYGRRGGGATNGFTSYGTASNGAESGFSNYGDGANAANDTFKNYGNQVNDPTNNFNNYADGGHGASDSFASYGEEANAGGYTFQSYARKSNTAKMDFTSYDKFDNGGAVKFTGYGKGAQGHGVGFKGYDLNRNTKFIDYAKHGVTFTSYKNGSSANGSLVKKWVEPGKFFRESMLKEGTVMPMPDIKDKMPPGRSFLPRSILSTLPFSTSEISELKKIFKVADNSSMEKILLDSLRECERAPSQGETKRCVGSIEDMIDFATAVLGGNVVVRTTENVNGSKKKVVVGSVKGINGGKVTESVSCHQSLFPYLLYYCHSVPKVRVYEADLLDPNSSAKINHGVAICHLDTTAWSPTHGAFLALGSGPGQIEVCHWIFENDMTWTIGD